GTSEKADAKKEDGTAILRMNNLTYEGELDFEDLKYIKLSKENKTKFMLNKGDILFNRTNSQDLVGKTALFDLDEEFVFASYLIRVKINKAKALPTYVVYYMNSNKIKKKLFNMAKASVNMANINAQEMLSIPIKIPALDKQKEIVSALDIQFKALHSVKELKKNSKKIIENDINSLW
ncbi:restriction endonuclease, partial [Candidatus Micrarchaeota archaeon CG11_big_fil_rev_8_21_14_0_20_47_5]